MASSFATSLSRQLLCGLRAKKPFPSTALPHTPSRLYSSAHPSISHLTSKKLALPLFFKGAAVAGIGLGISAFGPTVHADAPSPPTPPGSHAPRDIPPPPHSSLSLYELSFGTVTGVCAGVFIKKGAKAVAWFLGGIFVLLQYLGSASVVRVDWGRMASKFENMFYTTDAAGSTRAPTISSVWTWLVDFLTADFQPRASFLAGLALGLRIG